MTKRQGLRWSWFGILAAAYIALLQWYGGAGPAITPAEGRVFLERVRASSAANGHPEAPAMVERLIAQDDGREFYMLNLEQLKSGPTAQAEDRAYSRIVLPALLKRGSMPVYVGRVRGLLLGNDPNAFQRAALVRYRSLRDFLIIFTDPEVQGGVEHKFASMAYTEARATSPILSLLAIQVTAGAIFILLGIAGWFATQPARAAAEVASRSSAPASANASA